MRFAFTKIIKAGDRQREFNFTRMQGLDSIYNVDVNDDRGNRIIFKMIRDEQGELRITGAERELPNWVWDTSHQLSSAIQEHQG
ncbi:MAG TPA: hypothetical protein VHK69_02450 [Chitinophagaceae bacterium]|jgi:hypothetical protein|nr:hypothetical protein [Chitinophagaceae bacterium]